MSSYLRDTILGLAIVLWNGLHALLCRKIRKVKKTAPIYRSCSMCIYLNRIKALSCVEHTSPEPCNRNNGQQ